MRGDAFRERREEPREQAVGRGRVAGDEWDGQRRAADSGGAPLPFTGGLSGTVSVQFPAGGLYRRNQRLAPGMVAIIISRSQRFPLRSDRPRPHAFALNSKRPEY